MVWQAQEIEVSEGLVRSLLTDQHPDLAELPLVATDSGWDNHLWRLGDELLVRLPRRLASAPLTANEQRWLPELAPRLPLPIPAPLRMGRPSEDYPWSWSIVPWLDGCPGDRAVIDEPDQSAARLGEFLRALHHEAPANAPHNVHRGVPLRDRAGNFEARMAQLANDADVRGARRVWDRALATEPWRRPSTWIHGDLHPANTLFAGRHARRRDRLRRPVRRRPRHRPCRRVDAAACFGVAGLRRRLQRN